MAYHIRTPNKAEIIHPYDFRTIGQVFAKATELMQYMSDEVELLICNETDTPIYSVKRASSNSILLTELS